jgi:hypothetical protein
MTRVMNYSSKFLIKKVFADLEDGLFARWKRLQCQELNFDGFRLYHGKWQE